MTPDGSITIIHTFKDDADGFQPNSPLTEVDGKLFGAAQSSQYGVIFAISRTGEEQVLYRFKGGRDGGIPVSPVTAFKGSFYGTTGNWGDMTCNRPLGCGTVYKITPSRGGSYTETVIHRFAGGRDAGFVGGRAAPFAELNGTLYQGAASGGGGNCQSYSSGCGAIFSVTPSGQYQVVYRFRSMAEGAFPIALYALDGKLYGFALGGRYKCGTFFALSPSGMLQTLYAFKGGETDGCNPQAAIDYNGNFYGVTATGTVCRQCGAIFEITPSGHEHVLYAIANQRNGVGPSGLALLAGTHDFYGTTAWGGKNDCAGTPGCGVIFELTL